MTKSTTRWGIVGAGKVATLFADGLADAPGAEIAAVASRNIEKARAFGAQVGARRAHDSVAALAADPGVDVVYIATPNAEHNPMALRVLEAGKPVLCEKPFALDAAEAREIVALARRKRLFCMEAMWMRFIPAVRDLMDRVRDGELGEARSATIELGHPFVFDANHALFAPTGGGALLDLGPYTVSLALLLFGKATRVQSEATFTPSGVDEHVSALLRHHDGKLANLTMSLRTRLGNGAVIAGTSAIARLHEPLYRPESFTLTSASAAGLSAPTGSGGPGRGAALKRRLRRALSATRTLLSPLPSGRAHLRPCRGNGYQYQAIEVMRCLRAGELESPLMPLDASVQVMETLDAIRNAWKAP